MFSIFIYFSLTIFLVSANNIKTSGHQPDTEYGSDGEYSDKRKEGYGYEDYSEEREEISEEYEEDYDSMENWRTILRKKLKKKALDASVINSLGAIPPGRRFIIAEPIPPTAPNIDDLEEIRERLEGKKLEDTSFGLGSTAWAESNGNQESSSMRDLHKVICVMDCHIASAAQNSAFRGKEGPTTEEIFENHWNSMTEIERQLVKVVVKNANHTRPTRSISIATSGFFSSMFHVFSQWCSQNCGNPTTTKYTTEFPTTVITEKAAIPVEIITKEITPAEIILEENIPDDNLLDYESEESEELPERRFNSNSGNEERMDIATKLIEPVDILYEVKVPVGHLITQLFGQVTSTLSEMRLCVCGINITQICYCQPNNKSEPPVKLIPHN